MNPTNQNRNTLLNTLHKKYIHQSPITKNYKENWQIYLERLKESGHIRKKS